MRYFSCKHLAIPFLLVLAAIFTQLGAQPTLAATADVSSAADREFQREFGAAFLDRYWRLHPDDAIDQGYYKVADLLIVPDDASRADLLRFLQAALARLQKIP